MLLLRGALYSRQRTEPRCRDYRGRGGFVGRARLQGGDALGAECQFLQERGCRFCRTDAAGGFGQPFAQGPVLDFPPQRPFGRADSCHGGIPQCLQVYSSAGAIGELGHVEEDEPEVRPRLVSGQDSRHPQGNARLRDFHRHHCRFLRRDRGRPSADSEPDGRDRL